MEKEMEKDKNILVNINFKYCMTVNIYMEKEMEKEKNIIKMEN